MNRAGNGPARGAVMTLDQVMDACRELAYRVESSGEHPDALVGVARGGLTPAHWVAQFLGVPRVTAIDVGFVDDTRRGIGFWSGPVFTEPEPTRLLMVEDVVDTGRLLTMAAHLLDFDNKEREIRTATLWQTHRSLTRVDYVAAVVDEIPTMPWEVGREATEL